MLCNAGSLRVSDSIVKRRRKNIVQKIRHQQQQQCDNYNIKVERQRHTISQRQRHRIAHLESRIASIKTRTQGDCYHSRVRRSSRSTIFTRTSQSILLSDPTHDIQWCHANIHRHVTHYTTHFDSRKYSNRSRTSSDEYHGQWKCRVCGLDGTQVGIHRPLVIWLRFCGSHIKSSATNDAVHSRCSYVSR